MIPPDSVIPILLPLTFFFLPMVAAAIVGGLVAGPIFEALIRMKSRQTISQYVPEHAKKQGTPTMGGLIVGVGFLAGIVYTIIQLRGQDVGPGIRYYTAIAGLFGAFAVIGFVDDYVVPRALKGKRGLGWTQKLVLQIAAALLFMALLGRSIPIVPAVAGVFLILFFSNAYNFSDGLDGLASGLLLALVIGLAMTANARLESGLYPVLGALAGGTLPFLWLNLPPARLFMGDVGALPIGAVLGAIFATVSMPIWTVDLVHSVSADYTPAGLGLRPSALLYVALVILAGMMIFELVPVPLQILSVKVRKKRLFPRTPIHHAFQQAGWPEVRITLTFVAAQVLFSLVGGAMALSTKPSLDPVVPPRHAPHVAPGHQPPPMYNPDLPRSTGGSGGGRAPLPPKK